MDGGARDEERGGGSPRQAARCCFPPSLVLDQRWVCVCVAALGEGSSVRLRAPVILKDKHAKKHCSPDTPTQPTRPTCHCVPAMLCPALPAGTLLPRLPLPTTSNLTSLAVLWWTLRCSAFLLPW